MTLGASGMGTTGNRTKSSREDAQEPVGSLDLEDPLLVRTILGQGLAASNASPKPLTWTDFQEQVLLGQPRWS